MNSVKMNSLGFNYAIYLTKLLLLPFGIWPLKHSVVYHKGLRPILIAASLFVMLFMVIPLCLFIFLGVRDIRIRLKLLGPFGFSLMSLFKYIVVIAKRRQIADCLQNMIDDWQRVKNIDDRRIMLENAKFGRMLITVSLILMFGGGMPYVTIIPLTKKAIVVGNVTSRHLAYPAYFYFFDPRIRPIYDVIFVIQWVCGIVRYTVTCGVYSIIIVSVMHICSRISIISLMLKALADNYDKKLLGTVVKSHLQFLKFSAKLESIFKEICLVEVLGSSMIICFLGYSLITEYEQRETIATVTYLFLLMSFVFNIFILCYIGQILTEQCESIGTAAYMMNWYQLTGRDARNVVLLVSSNQRPVALTAGKIMKLSLSSFTNIIKAAASYLNMLRTTVANAS